MYYFAQKKNRRNSGPVFKDFLRRQRNLPNSPRKIKAGVALGEIYRELISDGKAQVNYKIVEKHGGLMVQDLVTDELFYVHEFDWEKMEKIHG